MIVDCKRQQTRAINRGRGDAISNSGIILLAQQIDDNTFFEVLNKVSFGKLFNYRQSIRVLRVNCNS